MAKEQECIAVVLMLILLATLALSEILHMGGDYIVTRLVEHSTPIV